MLGKRLDTSRPQTAQGLASGRPARRPGTPCSDSIKVRSCLAAQDAQDDWPHPLVVLALPATPSTVQMSPTQANSSSSSPGSHVMSCPASRLFRATVSCRRVYLPVRQLNETRQLACGPRSSHSCENEHEEPAAAAEARQPTATRAWRHLAISVQ